MGFCKQGKGGNREDHRQSCCINGNVILGERGNVLKISDQLADGCLINAKCWDEGDPAAGGLLALQVGCVVPDTCSPPRTAGVGDEASGFNANNISSGQLQGRRHASAESPLE